MNRVCKSSIMIAFAVALSACADEGRGADAYECVNYAHEEHPHASSLQETLDEAVSGALPGGMLYVRNSEGVWSGAAGFADLASGVPMQACHRMPVASNTKPLTAAVVVGLEMEGALSLEDPITDHLASSITSEIENSEEMTVAQLLNHTSGIFNYTHALKWLLDGLNRPSSTWTARECLEMALGQEGYFAPGTDWEYSNTNYLLLGDIIEDVAGQSTDVVFEERVFGPLGMDGATFKQNDFGSGYVRGYYDLYGNGAIVDVTDTIFRDCMTEDGGMIATAEDLGRFLDALVRDKTLVGEEGYARMTENLQDSGGGKRYGHGLEFYEEASSASVGHSGSKFGYLSDMRYFPEEDVTIVMLSNGSGSPSWPYESRLEALMERVLEISATE